MLIGISPYSSTPAFILLYYVSLRMEVESAGRVLREREGNFLGSERRLNTADAERHRLRDDAVMLQDR